MRFQKSATTGSSTSRATGGRRMFENVRHILGSTRMEALGKGFLTCISDPLLSFPLQRKPSYGLLLSFLFLLLLLSYVPERKDFSTDTLHDEFFLIHVC